MGPIGGLTCLDFSGYNRHGTLTNFGMTNTSGWGPGLDGMGALNFDGVNDYVIVTMDKSVVSNYTISFWLKSTGAQNTKGILAWQSALTSAAPFLLFWKSNATTLTYYANGANRISISSWPDDVWKLLTVTYDGTTHKLYLNDVLQASATAGASNTGTGVYFGNGYNGYFSGRIEGVRIYNRALTASEVIQIYNPVTRWELRYQLGLTRRFVQSSGAVAKVGASVLRIPSSKRSVICG